MQEHKLYMRRCLELAQLGAGGVSPNPMVGAVLVYEGRIIAENYHQVYGGPHAEALVIHEVLARHGGRAPEIFKNSTLYVNLEPCAHHGKTPPCAELIVKHQLKEVVVACRDPFEKVNGKGVSFLQAAGIKVTENVLAEEAAWLNRRFFTRVLHSRPYIILKWAQTSDGYFAPADGSQKWITGAESKRLVHRWRGEEDAVLVGTKTAQVDNPQLTVREWHGKNPQRVLIDRGLSVPAHSAIFDDAAETIVFNAVKSDWVGNIKYREVEHFDLYLPQKIAYQLYLMDIQSLIVEGGAGTLGLFIQADLWDEARVLTSPVEWGDGIPAPNLHRKATHIQTVGADRLNIYVNKKW